MVLFFGAALQHLVFATLHDVHEDMSDVTRESEWRVN